MDAVRETVVFRANGLTTIESRIPELDGFRGIAILLVLISHLGGVRALTGWYAGLVGLGWIGVNLFFVLSGFLITTILIREKGHPNYFRKFYRNRALRIAPLYCGYLIAFAFASGAPAWKQLAYWLYCGNFPRCFWCWRSGARALLVSMH